MIHYDDRKMSLGHCGASVACASSDWCRHREERFGKRGAKKMDMMLTGIHPKDSCVHGNFRGKCGLCLPADRSMLNEIELPRCACTNCKICGQPNWTYKGKVGCGNKDCVDYGMNEAHKMYDDNLKQIEQGNNMTGEISKEEIRTLLAPMFVEAREKGLWFYMGYQGLWFSPDELEKEHDSGQLIWGPVNWELRDPTILLEHADNGIVNAVERRDKVRKRLGLT